MKIDLPPKMPSIQAACGQLEMEEDPYCLQLVRRITPTVTMLIVHVPFGLAGVITAELEGPAKGSKNSVSADRA